MYAIENGVLSNNFVRISNFNMRLLSFLVIGYQVGLAIENFDLNVIALKPPLYCIDILRDKTRRRVAGVVDRVPSVH